jgi:hypothetical protein
VPAVGQVGGDMSDILGQRLRDLPAARETISRSISACFSSSTVELGLSVDSI